MWNTFSYFRSFQVMAILLIVTVISGCSIYPSIEPRKSISDSSAILTPVLVGEVIKTSDSVEVTDSIKEGEVEANSNPDNVAEKIEQLQEILEQSEQLNSNESLISEQIEDVGQISEWYEGTQSIVEEMEANQEHKKIAITFDDGPDLKFTPQILDILKEKDIKATFFVVGIQVEKYPDELKRIDQEGHLIGNHSYYHPSFTKLIDAELEKEIAMTDQVIYDALGYYPTIIRPPYGAINDEVRIKLEAMDKRVILWNIDPRDWDGTSVDDMLHNILSNAKDGGNILFHSFGNSKNVANTVSLLPIVIDKLHDLGYEFVTTDEL